MLLLNDRLTFKFLWVLNINSFISKNLSIQTSGCFISKLGLHPQNLIIQSYLRNTLSFSFTTVFDQFKFIL